MARHRALVPIDEIQFPDHAAEYALDGDSPGPAGVVVVPNADVPTQVANPTRTTIRSIVQGVVAVASVLPYVIPIVVGDIDVEWVAAAGVQILAVYATLTRIMAAPGVSDLIRRYLPWLYPIPLRDSGVA